MGGGVVGISFNVLLGFKPLLPMITGDTIGTTSGCVSPEETVDEKRTPIGDFPRVTGDVEMVEL